MNLKNLIASAVTAAVVLPPLALAGPAAQPAFKAEKCYGVAAASANDCETALHSCAGTTARARDKASWIYVPEGTCSKIEGGSSKPI